MIYVTAQKVRFFIEDFFSYCDQISRKLRIWSHLLKKLFVGKFIFCAVCDDYFVSLLLLLPKRNFECASIGF